MPYATAIKADTTHQEDFVLPYVKDLRNVVDMDAIRGAGLKLGVDPLGGAAVPYWEPINSVYRPGHRGREPDHRSDVLVHDGRSRRQDPHGSLSPYAMARLVGLKDRSTSPSPTIPTPIGTASSRLPPGLMNPNHYLAVAIRYLLTHRPQWPAHVAVGKTLVSSSMIDRVVHKLGRKLSEVPVGFKWFVPGLFDGSLCFGGEESAGASFLRHDGTVWTTDKDGLIMDLLAAEITARTGKDPGEHYRELTAEFGTPYYTRIDAPATPEQKARLQKLSPEAVATDDARRRADRSQTDPRPRNGAADRRPEGRDRQRLVRRPALRHREHLQDLCGELQGSEPPGRDRERSQEIVNDALDRLIRLIRNEYANERRQPPSLPPFPAEYRASGVLLHVTSLPSPYGIGDVGPAAIAWMDRLHEQDKAGGRRCRLGPTGYGNSPYQSLSSFAGNGLLISPDWLIEDGLLRASDCAAPSFSATAVDYEAVIPFKRRLLERAWTNSAPARAAELRVAFEQFCHDQAHWLEDYALFRALKVQVQRRLLPRVAERSWSSVCRQLWPRPGTNWRTRSIKFVLLNSCCFARASGFKNMPGLRACA